jgi:hypothetical protein
MLLALACFPLVTSLAAEKAEWRAGVAVADITPTSPTWMAGYAARKSPSQGTAQALHAKALALEDSRANRCIIVTTDLLGLPSAISEPIAEQIRQRYGLRRDQVLLTSSHTHSGPVLRESLISMYSLDALQAEAVRIYTARLQEQIADVVGAAIKDLSPARLSLDRTEAHFAVNRRLKKDDHFIIGVNPEGPVDFQVTILRVARPDDSIKAVLFSYACHNTTLTQDNYRFHGDYAGVAQEELEKAIPGATALFMLGCAADANPNPRGNIQLAWTHGRSLAQAVRYALSDHMRAVRGPLRTLFDRVDLPFAKLPTREELQARLQNPEVYVRRNAQLLLAALDEKGALPQSYSYPIGVVKFGGDLTLVALSGEVVVDYAIRLRKDLGSPGKLWIAAYANDVFAYIASKRLLNEGGYEADSSMIYYGLPGPWAPEVEDLLVGKVIQMVKAAK